jgi:KaiC/GvpD/RAD55 family RecA-like ATPase
MSITEEKRKELVEKYNFENNLSASSMLKMPKLSLEDRKDLFITYDFIPFPKNSVSLIAAAGGSGKTFLSIIVACEHILKEHTKGRSSKVLLWLSEDADYIVADRLTEKISKEIQKLEQKRDEALKKIEADFKAKKEEVFEKTLSKTVQDILKKNGIKISKVEEEIESEIEQEVEENENKFGSIASQFYSR